MNTFVGQQDSLLVYGHKEKMDARTEILSITARRELCSLEALAHSIASHTFRVTNKMLALKSTASLCVRGVPTLKSKRTVAVVPKAAEPSKGCI
jgi:hypothetical protein